MVLAEGEGFYRPLRGRKLSPLSELLCNSSIGPESNQGSGIRISHPNQIKRPHFGAFLFDLAEGEGFEPPWGKAPH